MARDDDALQTLTEAVAEALDHERPTTLWSAGAVHSLPWEGVDVVSWDRRSTAAGAVCCLTPPSEPMSRLSTGLAVRIPASRAAQDWMLAHAAATLPPGAALWVVGGQREGIKPLVKRLPGFGLDDIEVRRIKRRMRVVRATRSEETPQAPSLDRLEERFELMVGRNKATCVSLPGVFAHGRVDPGTQLLVSVLVDRRPKAGRTVDLGCGCGALSVATALARPKAAVSAVDIHAVAVEATRRTIAANALDGRVEVFHRTAMEAAAEFGGRHDLVVTNAPFHDGQQTDRGLMIQFATAARQLLRPGGQLLLVANHHLPYPAVLTELFGRVGRAAGDGRYVVYHCS